MKSVIRVRLSTADAHYGGNLASGSKALEFFGDVATELLIRLDGDEGLFRAYDNVEFLAPMYAGDYLEVEGEITKVGNSSRTMKFAAWKVIEAEPQVSPTAARVLPERICCVKATGTCVVPKELQRNPNPKV